MDRTLIAGTTIFDGSGAAPFTGDVLVEGQRIAAVQRGGGLPRGDARVIDGTGATLMPGLIEPHGHLSYPDAARNSDFTRLPPEEHVLITMRNAKTALDCGYTSVLSAASAKPRLDIVIRNEINAGRSRGRAIWPTGRRSRSAAVSATRTCSTCPRGDADLRLGGRRPRRDPQGLPPAGARGRRSPEAQSLGRHRAAQQPLRAGGDDGRRGGGGDGDRAGRRRARVRARPQRGVGQDVRPPRHRHHLSRQFRRRGSARPAGGQPGLVLRESRPRPHPPGLLRGRRLGLHARMARERGLLGELEVSVDTFGQMRKRGIRVLPGGDYGFAWNPHGTYARDLLLFVDVLGFTPMETLVAATRLGGEIMGWATSWARSSRASSPTCCWSTATRSRTSSGCRTRTRC